MLRVGSLLACTIAACCLPVPLAGQGQDPEEVAPAPGQYSLTSRMSLYYRNDPADGGSAGNPFLDEDLIVVEPAFLFSHQVDADFGYTVSTFYDRVSSASIQKIADLSRYPNSQQSGASGDFYAGADAAFRYQRTEELELGWHAGAAGEFDYRSIGLGGNLAREFDKGNVRLTFDLDGYFDWIDIIRFDGSEDGNDNRNTLSATATAYRVLTPKMHGVVGVTQTEQSGFLSTPYNSILAQIPGGSPSGEPFFEDFEVLPDARSRTALFGRIRRNLFAGTSLELGGRAYSDNWGVNAWSLEPRLYQTVVEDRLLLRLRWRHYTQNAADAWAQTFVYGLVPTYHTQDADLGPFDSTTLGLKLVWQYTDTTTFDLSLDRIARSDDLDHHMLSFGWKWVF